ncbi:hypothetical protein SAMN02745206_00502 [Desulfacinum infernum DSM 9756]|uniref:Uncharacterized protein n=1 Tax=Desulfacinum infernum DSM 9756 TaxID=1121391 RepID=A0A1M4UK08_9BACT|nr:hypothetical protein [Desulfacinum infernum]SHE56995.1 hypothetical protein SAMN02745206_00502 [Desulfacinum infernum DSM 9756]
MRVRVFAIRAFLGIFFALFLSRFFFPQAPAAMIGVLAILLIFSAYVLEALRKKGE